MNTSSLKFRIILSLVIIVTVTGSLFAFGVLMLKQRLEEVIFGHMVQDQLVVILEQVDDGSYDSSQLFKGWTLYSEDDEALAPELRELDPGSHHHVIIDGSYYQVEVADRNGERYYLAHDITEWEDLEHRLLGWLAVGILLLAVVTIFMGFAASRSILSPVNRFTQRVLGIQPGERNVRIQDEFSESEIGQIASAFDQYLARMDHFVDRERSFTAAASHELRNPLSVMLGALDVIDSAQQDAATKRATERLRRAIAEMQAFIEAALLLAREESQTLSNESGGQKVSKILDALIEDWKPVIERQEITVVRNYDADFALTQPGSLLKIIFGNLLRNAIEHTQNGEVSLTLGEGIFIIRDEGEGIAEESLPHIFDRSFSTKHQGTGMGLDLVRRICDRFSWTVEVTSKPGAGTQVTISFTDAVQ
jgi:signal transduction histidine kinase